MNNLWDTTIPVFEFPNDFRKVYETIYISQRKSFSDWVGKISKIFKSDLDWWSSSVSSRNTYISKLFHNICILESLKNLEKKNKFPNEVKVSTLQLKKIINFYFKGKKIEVKKNIQLNAWIKKVYFIFWPLTSLMFIILFSRIFKCKNSSLKGNENILIDIFITSENLSNDRYYNKLEKKKLNNKKNIYFVPTILNVSILKLPKLIKQIRNNKNFILKEDFINFSDIVYAFNYIFRKKNFILTIQIIKIGI